MEPVEVAPHPVRGAGEALLEAHLGHPASPLPCPRGVAQEALDLAAAGPEPRLVHGDLSRAAGDLDEQAHEVADADLAARADVDDVADRSVTGCDGEEAGDGVVDVVEVAGGGGGAELDDLGAGVQLAQDRRDHGPGRLTRPVGVERTNDRHGELEGVVERQRHHVAADLARGVRGLRLEGVVLGDGHRDRRAVGLARGRVHHAGDTRPPARERHVLGPLDVHLHVAVRRHVAVGDPDERGEVEHDLAAVDRLERALRIPDVAGEEPHAGVHLGVEPARSPERVVEGEGGDLGSLAHEALHQGAADEALTAGDGDLHA